MKNWLGCLKNPKGRMLFLFLIAMRAKVPFDRFPRSLKKAHDLMLREYKYIKDEKQRKEVIKLLKMGSFLFDYICKEELTNKASPLIL